MNSDLLSFLEKAVSRIPVIDSATRYWFIRTNRGEFFQDFLQTGTVGIGYDRIPLGLFKSTLDAKGNPADLFESRYPELEKAGRSRATGLILRFVTEMQPGDVVVMPSFHSYDFAFGVVKNGQSFELTDKINGEEPSFKKRRSVKWLQVKSRNKIDPNLRSAFISYQTLSDATQYGALIDREIYSLYTREGKTHLKLEVNHEEQILTGDFFKMGSALLDLSAEIEKEVGLSKATEELEFRTNVQSPGFIEFISQNPMLILGLASLAVLGINGGGLKIKKGGFELDLSTPGLLKSVSNFLNNSTKRQAINQVLENKMGALEMGTPQDLLSTFDEHPPKPNSPAQP